MRHALFAVVLLAMAGTAHAQGLTVTTDGFEEGVSQSINQGESIRLQREAEARARAEANRSTIGSGAGTVFRCKFCCEGQWGACRSSKFDVKVSASSIVDAKREIKNEYEKICSKYPFYSGGGGAADVGYADCSQVY